MTNNKELRKIVLAGLMLALAMVLPLITANIPQIGNMLCPMHLPILLCGFICDWKYGMTAGAVAPLLRSLSFGNPAPFFPRAVTMSVELMVYGLVAGLMYKILPKKKSFIYVALVVAMLAGRVASLFMKLFVAGVMPSNKFEFAAFLSGAFVEALPGIVLQLILVPFVVMFVQKRELSGVEE